MNSLGCQQFKRPPSIARLAALCITLSLTLSCYAPGPYRYELSLDPLVIREEEPSLRVSFRLHARLAEGLGSGWLHFECRTTQGRVIEGKTVIPYLHQGRDYESYVLLETWLNEWEIESLVPTQAELHMNAAGAGLLPKFVPFTQTESGWEAIYP